MIFSRWLPKFNRQISLNQELFHGVVVILGLYLVVRFSLPQIFGRGLLPNDFMVFYTASQRYFAGKPFYLAYEASPFKYPPAFLTTFGLLLPMVKPVFSWALWSMASIGIFLFSMTVFYRQLQEYTADTGKILDAFSALAITFLSLIPVWHGILEHLSYGQSDFLVFGLLSLGFFMETQSFERDYSFLAPCFCALALLIKPISILFMVSFLLLRNISIFYRLAFWLSGIVLFNIFITFLIRKNMSGIDDYLLWFRTLNDQPWDLFYGNLNQSLASTAARMLKKPQWAKPLCNAVFFIGCISSFLFATKMLLSKKVYFNKANSQLYVYTLGILSFLIFNPLSWRWLTFLWWPITLYYLMQWRKTKYAMIIFFTIALLLQKNLAKYLGIKEIDLLSYWGFYTLGTLALCLPLKGLKRESKVYLPSEVFKRF